MSRTMRIFAAAAGLALASGTAFAEPPGGPYDAGYDRSGDFDFAPVVHVEPVRRQVRVSTPVRECWQETSYAPSGPLSSGHAGATLLGSAIGVVIGNQIGHGRGKDAARVAGALVGGAIGHDVSVQRQRELYGERGRTVERCGVSYRDSWEERIDGYDVTYRYAGREYFTRMPFDPGDRIRVRVDVTPAVG
jgi:uncharacterized protein YcfJ